MEYNYAFILLAGLLFNNLVAGQYSSSSTTFGKSSSEQHSVSGQQGHIGGSGSVGPIQDVGSLPPFVPPQGPLSGIVQDQPGVIGPTHESLLSSPSQFPFVKSFNSPLQSRSSFGGPAPISQTQFPYYPFSSKAGVPSASPYYGYNPYYSASYYPSAQSYSALPYSGTPYPAVTPYSAASSVYPSAAASLYPSSAASLYPSSAYFGYPNGYPYNYNAGAYVPGLSASYYQQPSPVEVQTSVKDK